MAPQTVQFEELIRPVPGSPMVELHRLHAILLLMDCMSACLAPAAANLRKRTDTPYLEFPS